MRNRTETDLKMRVARIEIFLGLVNRAIQEKDFIKARHLFHAIEYSTKGRRYKKFKFKLNDDLQNTIEEEKITSESIDCSVGLPELSLEELESLFKQTNQRLEFARDYLHNGHLTGANHSFQNLFEDLKKAFKWKSSYSQNQQEASKSYYETPSY